MKDLAEHKVKETEAQKLTIEVFSKQVSLVIIILNRVKYKHNNTERKKSKENKIVFNFFLFQ